MELQVACAQPGVYDLSGLGLTACTPDHADVKRTLVDERLLVIDHSTG